MRYESNNQLWIFRHLVIYRFSCGLYIQTYGKVIAHFPPNLLIFHLENLVPGTLMQFSEFQYLQKQFVQTVLFITFPDKHYIIWANFFPININERARCTQRFASMKEYLFRRPALLDHLRAIRINKCWKTKAFLSEMSPQTFRTLENEILFFCLKYEIRPATRKLRKEHLFP